ncbi:MAG: hypothetical protein JZD41_06575 [Thermoproteus sp.]|nr:hypothetical protein [Thermoproteus sp.]
MKYFPAALAALENAVSALLASTDPSPNNESATSNKSASTLSTTVENRIFITYSL